MSKLDSVDRGDKGSRAGTASSPPTNGRGGSTARQRDLRIGFLIHDVSRLRRRAFDELMRPFAVTRTQWWVIAHLSRQDGMTQTRLAEILDVGKASLGTVIERLEAAGLVRRRPDPEDGRGKRVFMTRKAHQLIRKMQGAERSYNAHILKSLSDTERDELARMLSLIKAALADFNQGAAGRRPERGRPAGNSRDTR